MAFENFTTYDKTDEGTNITVIASKVSWAGLGRDDSSHVSDSKGVGHFSGDFAHKFECLWENEVEYGISIYWSLANQQGDFKEIRDASGDFLTFHNEDGTFVLNVDENGSSADQEVYAVPAESTLHFVTITRDDDGGANNTGQLVALIRTGSHSGNLEATLTADCSVGEQNDFEFVFGLMSYDDNQAPHSIDGYTQNLDLQEGAPPSANPKGPLGHPLCGAFAGPISF